MTPQYRSGRAPVRNWASASVQIASGSSLSGSVVLGGRYVSSLKFPAAWTASKISFDVKSNSEDAWMKLYADDGALVVLTVTACTGMGIKSTLDSLAGWYGLRILSGSDNSKPEDQAAARTIWIHSMS